MNGLTRRILHAHVVTVDDPEATPLQHTIFDDLAECATVMAQRRPVAAPLRPPS